MHVHTLVVNHVLRPPLAAMDNDLSAEMQVCKPACTRRYLRTPRLAGDKAEQVRCISQYCSLVHVTLFGVAARPLVRHSLDYTVASSNRMPGSVEYSIQYMMFHALALHAKCAEEH
jgi:hypothetical protein